MTSAIPAEIENQLDEPRQGAAPAVAPERRRRIGRPPRNEPVKIVSLSISLSLHKALSEEAKVAGLRTASYILSRVTEASPPRIIPALNVGQWDGLRRQLDDLTTVFRRAHEAKVVPDSVEEKMVNITEEIRRLRLLLLGIEAKK
jgi:hypothetical protein